MQQLTARTGSARTISWVAGLLALLVIGLIITLPGGGTGTLAVRMRSISAEVGFHLILAPAAFCNRLHSATFSEDASNATRRPFRDERERKNSPHASVSGVLTTCRRDCGASSCA